MSYSPQRSDLHKLSWRNGTILLAASCQTTDIMALKTQTKMYSKYTLHELNKMKRNSKCEVFMNNLLTKYIHPFKDVKETTNTIII